MSTGIFRCVGLGTVLAPVILGGSLCGCTPAGDGEAPAATRGQPSAAALAVLARADAADGTTDRVVAKCVTCRLGMSGSAEHAVTLGEYVVHLCSGECKAKFEGDPEAALLAVKLPGGEDPAPAKPGGE